MDDRLRELSRRSDPDGIDEQLAGSTAAIPDVFMTRW
jgi:hypothetical protein